MAGDRGRQLKTEWAGWPSLRRRHLSTAWQEIRNRCCGHLEEWHRQEDGQGKVVRQQRICWRVSRAHVWLELKEFGGLNRKWGQRENTEPHSGHHAPPSATSYFLGACYMVAQSRFSRCPAEDLAASFTSVLATCILLLFWASYPFFPSLSSSFSSYWVNSCIVYWHLHLSGLFPSCSVLFSLPSRAPNFCMLPLITLLQPVIQITPHRRLPPRPWWRVRRQDWPNPVACAAFTAGSCRWSWEARAQVQAREPPQPTPTSSPSSSAYSFRISTGHQWHPSLCCTFAHRCFNVCFKLLNTVPKAMSLYKKQLRVRLEYNLLGIMVVGPRDSEVAD